MYEDFKSIQGTSGHIINYIGAQLFKAPLRILSEQLLGSRLCKNFHRYGIVFIFKRFFQACLIMHQVVLSRRPKKLSAIDRLYILNQNSISSSHHSEIPHTSEKRLDVMGDSEPQSFVYLVSYAFLYVRPSDRLKIS